MRLMRARSFTGPFLAGNRSLMNVRSGCRVKSSRSASQRTQQPQARRFEGHRSVGDNASIYNAVPREGVVKLIEFMKDFQKKNYPDV